jgi:1-deoxy-D-xylulose-5-phosphate synthase
MTSLLSTIDSPEGLKTLSLTQLQQLADELRERIIEVMAVNGGHLASSLGTVELTIALHKVFNTPQDKLIWDIGHQTYSHKLMTGRKEAFSGVRQYRGLSGFCQPQESPYDHFHTGHAGQALSIALGVAKSRDLIQRQEYIVPILGDAALTCGLSFEALNNMSRDLKKFIVILNDNNMSISQNVGCMKHILSRILSNPTCTKLHQELDAWVQKIPTVGGMLSNQGHRIAESMKNLVSPAVFFEHFGLSYIGPIDGHDIKKLIDVLEGVKDSSWPVVVHVLTRKGEGMQQALDNPTPYHGARPFDIQTGKFHPTTSTARTFPKIFGDHVLKMAQEDPALVTVTPAMSAGSCLDEMMKKFPERCFDVGIAEGHAVTFAGGLAYGGDMKVIACLYSTFLQRALDNVYHDVCLQELPVVFAIDRAGIAGGDGAMANGIYDIGFLNGMPNMVIAQPRDGKVLTELLESAFSYGRPTAIRYPNINAEEPSGPFQRRELGKGELIVKGKDVLIIALGHMCHMALKVRQLLESDGIEASVLDPIFVKPLDTELLCQLLMTHQKVITIEENSLQNGLGAIINHFLLSNGYSSVQVANFGVPETFVQQGSHKELLDEIGLTPEKITASIKRQLLSSKEALQPL